MVRRTTIIISVLVIGLAGIALPVQGFFQAHSFFNPSNKYRNWFHETVWLQDLNAEEAYRMLRRRPIRASVAVKYPYPDKDFVMTKQQWLKSKKSVEFGNPDWFDVEIVRQRAEVEEFPPAMDFLAWMYEEGRGLNRDFRKAFQWYERAKLNGHVNLRGNSVKIFERLKGDQRFLARLQLAEDIQLMKNKGQVPVVDEFEAVKLHVFKEQRETELLRKKREILKRRQKNK
tara:strand:+ start:217 stop:906 length:690 start_codon:yes stop_codon:yes gene_type:complete